MKIKIRKINKNVLLLTSAFILLIVGAYVFPPMIEIGVTFLFIFTVGISVYSGYCRNNSAMISWAIAIVVLISAVQNVYLGISVYKLSALELQILLSVNIAIVVVAVFIKILKTGISSIDNWCLKLIGVILVMAFVSLIIYTTSIAAFLSSLRNIIAPIFIYLYAVQYSTKINGEKIYDLLFKIAWFVILFGLFEYFLNSQLWQAMNIEKLWNLKGISVNAYTKLPNNWYSSELIGGVQIRRMVSSFADPVNLGTYLFAMFVLAWYRNKKVLQIAIVVCCVLTISKGALLGFLIFFFFFFWFKDKSKISIPIIVGIISSVCIVFLLFSKSSSTGSVMLHISGFFSSLKVLFTHPMGYGVGRVGVLASLLTNDIANSAVVETGIGVIIAQLGIIGLIIYIVFYMKLIMNPKKWKSSNVNDNITYFSLLFSFLANVMFNEVALSPNSCAVYFIVIGVIESQERLNYEN